MAGIAVCHGSRVLLVFAAAVCAAAPAPPGAPDFRKDVQPVLRASCYACHAGAQPVGKVRLDDKAAAASVIVPGRSRDSRLMQRVLGLGKEPRMPLGGAPLSAAQTGILRRWIDAGAPWPASAVKEPERSKHWAYVPPTRPAAPPVKNAAWARNAIDALVLARLEKEGLAPSPEAPRETLIRRLSLDLTGLPPSVREVDAFVADGSPDAYEKLVDRLLASPRFGERWARPWLDYARYADTNGYEADRRRTMWKYRDWLIGALNRDVPFDRFTIEQIAGDMLPESGKETLVATGFHRNTMFNEEGGVDKAEAHWLNLTDRVNTTATVWLGSTVGCAQCHDHKFDPFSQKEYYRFLAFFDNSSVSARQYGDTSVKFIEPMIELPEPAQEERRKKLKEEIAGLEELLKTNTPELERAQAAWEKSVLAAPGEWKVLKPAVLRSTGGATLTWREDGSIFASGANPAVDDYVLEYRLPEAGITGIRIEALPDAGLPRGGPGRDAYGNFFLNEVVAELVRDGRAERIPLPAAAIDDGRLEDDRSKQFWAVDASREDRRVARQLVLEAVWAFGAPGDTLRVSIRQKSMFGGQGLGCFRVSLSRAEDPKVIAAVSLKVRGALLAEAAGRTPAQRKQLEDYYRSVAPALADARESLQELRKEVALLEIPTALVMGEAPGFDRPSTEMRIRGTFTNPGERVYAGLPAVLPALPESALPNRLGLARWLVSRENPLTARVTVNRIWETYFGRGIVETAEDFGSQGLPPTHPELLDWLAVEFMENGWSMKKMHRLIVTSAAYRQSSAANPAALERDPYNLLLARGPRFRVEAEMVRDIALEASGLLSAKIGGPSVFPYQPEGIWDLPYNDEKWIPSEGEDRHRRGIYIFLRRTAPYPAFVNFDYTSRETCTVRRTRTNTPLQALTTLNDPAFFEAAQALARRVLSEGGGDARARAEYAFRLCASRRPKPAEMERMLGALDRELTWFAAHREEARKIAGSAEGTAETAAEAAAWTMLANALLNLDETITKE